MEVLFAVAAGVLYTAGIYLMLRRRLAQLIIGLGCRPTASHCCRRIRIPFRRLSCSPRL
jgi:multisubunit Na+/H+ antiporter MnhC subunit